MLFHGVIIVLLTDTEWCMYVSLMVQIVACCLSSTKLLSEAIFFIIYWNLLEKHSIKLLSKCNFFIQNLHSKILSAALWLFRLSLNVFMNMVLDDLHFSMMNDANNIPIPLPMNGTFPWLWSLLSVIYNPMGCHFYMSRSKAWNCELLKD